MAGLLLLLQHAPQVAVRNDPDQAVAIDHHGCSQSLGGHLQMVSRMELDGLTVGFSLAGYRSDTAGRVVAQEPPGWKREILGGKSPLVQQGGGQGVAQGHLRGGAGRRGEVVGIGFLVDRGEQHQVRLTGQITLRLADHPDQGHDAVPEQRQQHL